jgi:3',5'-cyclic AMP phosphodiesterase CpdA
MARPWPWPSKKQRWQTLHLIGDLHAGINQIPAGINELKRAIVLADVKKLPRPLARVQVGDITESGVTVQDQAAIAWMKGLGGPWYTALGNHDIMNDTRTTAQWLKVYGLASKSYTVDLGFAKLIFVGHDGGYTLPLTLNATTLTWLTDQLASAGKPCFIVNHAPLANTVLGDITKVFSSAETYFKAEPDADIRAVLNAQPNAKAWISGHTHSPIDTPGFIKSESVGTRSIISINCSALLSIGRTVEPSDPLITLYMTYTGSALEIRFRNHGAGIWDAIGGSRVVTMPIPA